MDKKFEKNPDEIGILWEKTNKSGGKWYSGILEINGEKINIVIFSNNGKSEKAPTHVILKSKSKDYTKFKQETKSEVKINEQGFPQIDINEDIKPEDLPF